MHVRSLCIHSGSSSKCLELEWNQWLVISVKLVPPNLLFLFFSLSLSLYPPKIRPVTDLLPMPLVVASDRQLTVLNKSVKGELHTLPAVDQILAQLTGAKLFTKLDANSANTSILSHHFTQMDEEIRERYRERERETTRFCSHK